MWPNAVTILATFVLLLPSLRSQCVDCSKHWHAKCKTKVTGHFCEEGASVFKEVLEPSEYLTSTQDPFNLYSSCVPYPLRLDYVSDFCCFWSEKLGCQLTLHPQKYEYGNPKRFCDLCRNRCQCDGSLSIRSFSLFFLLGLTVILLQFI